MKDLCQVPIFTKWKKSEEGVHFYEKRQISKNSIRVSFASSHYRGGCFPGSSDGKESARRKRFNPWVGKLPQRREWLPTPVFLPREFRGQRSLVGYSPWHCWVGHYWAISTFIFIYRDSGHSEHWEQPCQAPSPETPLSISASSCHHLDLSVNICALSPLTSCSP